MQKDEIELTAKVNWPRSLTLKPILHLFAKTYRSDLLFSSPLVHLYRLGSWALRIIRIQTILLCHPSQRLLRKTAAKEFSVMTVSAWACLVDAPDKFRSNVYRTGQLLTHLNPGVGRHHSMYRTKVIYLYFLSDNFLIWCSIYRRSFI